MRRVRLEPSSFQASCLWVVSGEELEGTLATEAALACSAPVLARVGDDVRGPDGLIPSLGQPRYLVHFSHSVRWSQVGSWGTVWCWPSSLRVE